MNFWIAYALGILTVIIILPLISKLLVKLAMKRELGSLIGGITKAGEKFETMIKTEAKEDKDGNTKQDSKGRESEERGSEERDPRKDFGKGIEFIN